MKAILLGCCATIATATAQVYNYNQTVFPTGNSNYGPGEGYSQLGGKITNIDSTYDKGNKTLSWDATLETHYPNNNGVPHLANSYFLVLSNGPDPKNNDKHVAVLFDGTDLNSPKVSFYTYSAGSPLQGLDPNTVAFLDGTENPNADLIATSYSINTTQISPGVQSRTFSLTLNTNLLNDVIWANSKDNAINSSNWNGIGFGDAPAPNDNKIGLWFHPLGIASTTYDASDGSLTDFKRTTVSGYLDLNNKDVTIVPEPSSTALLGLASLTVLMTRRRK